MGLLRKYCNQDWRTTHLEKLLAAARSSARAGRSDPLPTKANAGLSEDQRAELLGLYEGGASTYELARRFKIRRDMVTTYLKRAGLAVRPGPRLALGESAEREAARLYASGLSLRQIAQRMGVSDNTVLKALRAQRVPSRPRRGGITK